MVLFATWTVVALLIAGYIWFVVWRVRMDRRKKEAKAGGGGGGRIGDGGAAPGLAARLKEQGAFPPRPSSEPSLSPEPFGVPSAVDVAPVPSPATAAGFSVTELLKGIRLPEDLVPITMMAPREDVGERVAFASDPGADAQGVGTAFADELRRLGYTVSAVGADQLAATRGEDHLLCQLHLDARYAEVGGKRAFPAVADGVVVVEVWVPF